ncbi:MAG: hypothetical protein WAK82_29640 [Streptosporangiaceae bacterium]
MASLVLTISVSPGGYVAPVDRSTGWIAAAGSDDGLSWSARTVRNAAAHLMGAATYAAWAGAGERIFLAPLTIEPVSTTIFSGGAVAHVFAAHP